MAAAINLVTRAIGPHLPLIVLCDRGHKPGQRLGAPDQGTDQGPDSVAGPSQEEINLTLSPLISCYNLNFRLKLNILISFPIPSQISA
jgi:hypothetical protein